MGRKFEVRKASMMKTGLAKAKVYSRHSKEIYIAAKSGGTEAESNLELKRCIDKAKKDNVPADVIKRAIDKVNSGTGEDYKNNMYEGFGPNGSTIIVECLTDNANRTISEVKNAFTKSNNKIGVAGSVSHMYSNVGVFVLSGVDEDEVVECLIDNDLDVMDIEVEDDNTTITCDIADFNAIRTVLTSKFEDKIEADEITWLSQIETDLQGEDAESFEKMINMLNECDDVQNLFHNVTNI